MNLEQLKKIDRYYFKDYDGMFDVESITYRLATYLFDNDISSGLDEEHWKIFGKIKEVFGDKIAWEVIRKLCYREHDT